MTTEAECRLLWLRAQPEFKAEFLRGLEAALTQRRITITAQGEWVSADDIRALIEKEKAHG
jgi:hypothetical protein